VRGGAEGLIGQIGVVRNWSEEDRGSVALQGAVWHARRSHGLEEEPEDLRRGDRVVVERLTGLTLAVRPAEEWELI
jgi:membrane protein implicated in regulation of membrane protease activity